MKALVVDDDPIVRTVLSVALQKLGFCEVLTAENGEDAAWVYTENEYEICLVSSDLNMPNLDGIEFIQFLSERLSEPQVILVSGAHESIRTGAKALATIRKLNLIGSFSKPVPITDFQKLAGSALEAASEEEGLV